VIKIDIHIKCKKNLVILFKISFFLNNFTANSVVAGKLLFLKMYFWTYDM